MLAAQADFFKLTKTILTQPLRERKVNSQPDQWSEAPPPFTARCWAATRMRSSRSGLRSVRLSRAQRLHKRWTSCGPETQLLLNASRLLMLKSDKPKSGRDDSSDKNVMTRDRTRSINCTAANRRPAGQSDGWEKSECDHKSYRGCDGTDYTFSTFVRGTGWMHGLSGLHTRIHHRSGSSILLVRLSRSLVTQSAI